MTIRYFAKGNARVIHDDVNGGGDDYLSNGYTEYPTLETMPIDAATQSATARKQAQNTGIQWHGHTIQLHRDDALVMLQVKAAFEFGANATIAEFANGEKVPITAAEFPALAQQFVTARNALFGGS